MAQKLFLKSQIAALQANFDATQAAQMAGHNEPDHKPVVKLFCPWGAATWLLTEADFTGTDDPSEALAFGLCDLGMGSPELGYVDLSELTAVRGPLGLAIERDVHFKASKPLTEYAEEAYSIGRIAA